MRDETLYTASVIRNALLLSAAMATAIAGCTNKGSVEVDGILVPQARGFIAAKEGPTLHIPGDDISKLPDAPVVRLAIARDVPWNEIDELIGRIEQAGKEPVLLVGDKWRSCAPSN